PRTGHRYAWRPRRVAARPGAAAGRDRGASFRLSVRSARGRSPAGEAPAHSPAIGCRGSRGAGRRETVVSAALARIGGYLRALSGWRALLASILAGAFYALGFAPLGLFPAMPLRVVALVLLLVGIAVRPRPVRCADAFGWGFDLGRLVTRMSRRFY